MAWDSLVVGDIHNTLAVLMVDLDTLAAVEGIYNFPMQFAPLEGAVKVVDSMTAVDSMRMALLGVPLWAVRRKAVAAGSRSIVR